MKNNTVKRKVVITQIEQNVPCFDFTDTFPSIALTGNSREFSDVIGENIEPFWCQVELLLDDGALYDAIADYEEDKDGYICCNKETPLSDLFYTYADVDTDEETASVLLRAYEHYHDNNVLSEKEARCLFLSIITGSDIRRTTLRGYSQSDWIECYYPAELELDLGTVESYFFGMYIDVRIDDSDEEFTYFDQIPHSMIDDYIKDYTDDGVTVEFNSIIGYRQVPIYDTDVYSPETA